MKISTSVRMRKHIYWADVAWTVMEWVGTVAVAGYIALMFIDTMFPNTPLH